MSNLTEWIKSELYPALFDRIDQAFPEHKFTRFPGGWRSNTYLNGSPHKRADKVVVSNKTPGRILEQGGDNLSLVDYIIRRDNLNFIEAVKYLADIAGLQVPRDPEFNEEAYRAKQEEASLLEQANSYFTYCLENAPGAEPVRAYLGSRGYRQETIKAMELGYIPPQEKLIKHLKEKGYSQELISRSITLNSGIGKTHSLTIPYRSGGTLKGFKFRTIGDHKPKYLNSTGLDRIGGFFNISSLKGDKDLVIVEGELDALHATALGVDNVVATGGSSVSDSQIKDAIRKGAKSFTLCFDYEAGKEGKTARRVNSVYNVITENRVNKVYIVEFPHIGERKTDPDSLIRERGIGAFKKAIAEAIPYHTYRLQEILRPYRNIHEERDLTPKEKDALLDEISETSSRLREPIEREQFINTFLLDETARNLGIKEETLEATAEKLAYNKDREKQAQELQRLINETKGNLDKGEPEKALETLEYKLRDVKASTGRGLLPSFMSYDTLQEEIATLPASLKTGYPSLDEFIGFTPGAISLIAGRPSHGKTTFLYNLLLKMSNIYPDKKFYFFTYEEPLKNLSVKILNNLTDSELGKYFKEYDLSKPTNYEFIKAYIRFGRSDIEKIENAKKKLQELIDSRKITLIDKNYSVEELSKVIAYLNKEGDVGAVFIDYIQRMRTDRRTQDKRTEIGHISDQVLQIAKENNLPVILGAQLNRSTQKNRPTLENLKEAGNLEEDANTVISIYNEHREDLENKENGGETTGRYIPLEIKALKNREGEANRKTVLTFDQYTGVIYE